jgi:hypothetical protein
MLITITATHKPATDLGYLLQNEEPTEDSHKKAH